MNSLAKRALDVLVSAALLVLLAPLLAAIALLVAANLGGPVLFRQSRSGLHELPFTLLKFRTMTYAVDRRGRLLTDDDRLTPLGRWLRRTSLDELPQLWNVFTGSMSLVGPRPLLMDYLGRYSTEQSRRHSVKPGITGWAQVCGRNALSWEQKFTLDLWYVDHWSFARDLQILAETLWRTLRAEGISQPGHATAEEFRGASPVPDPAAAAANRKESSSDGRGTCKHW